ncbi:rRNA maturation RNase YbeY [Euhalothece natronophila Z-M001]|uniref:Endoribonuclease YbeY n=1 Tax=Euhalothece natronophila Z-M001 TaxID=522448 RepID=A0A5B8NNU9_9CHRO|nr:rRNA maturation RNase YbeY [Euhalothece natronophila]QDZ40627.1 rRNA maturation RNase YbeY [Euhalothece natronophila Z-M001]
MSVPLSVYIQSHIQEATLPKESIWEQWFQKWVDALKAELPPATEYELTLCLANNTKIKTLNAQYRQKDQPTDVLAFATLENSLSEAEKLLFQEEPLYLGDIIISVETAREQAKTYEHSLEQELAWLATHGLLHLLGWDHPDDESLEKMLAHQETLLLLSGHKVMKN